MQVVRTNQIPRMIPQTPWYVDPKVRWDTKPQPYLFPSLAAGAVLFVVMILCSVKMIHKATLRGKEGGRDELNTKY